MLKYNRLFLLISIAVLAACESQRVAKKTYLDIDSLINVQIKSLVTANAHVIKNASLNNEKAKSEFAMDSLGWATELDIFRQLDVINKPTNKDLYLVIDDEKDVNSNLTIRQYKAKRELPVKMLSLYYYKNLQNLKKIQAVFKEKNALYATERSLMMEFDEVNGNSRLVHYSIDGIQKMILGDTIRFTIHCDVIF